MQIYWLLTEHCNLKCEYCIRGELDGANVNVNEFSECIQRNDFSKDQILLTGGEPMLHPEFDILLRHALNNAKNVAVNTNGTINKFNLMPHSKRLHIQISLDGLETIHDKIRTNGSFELVWRNIQTIERLGICYNIATVVNSSNIEHIEEMIPYLQTLRNMRYWKIEPQLPFGCGTIDECIDNARWNTLVDKLIQCTPFRLRIKKVFDFSLVENLSIDEIDEYGKKNMHNCGTCKSKIYVYPDFSVYPCTCLKEYKLGNLLDATLDEILCKSEAKIFSEYKVLPKSKCAQCRYLHICNGGCIGMSQHFFGKLGMGDARCPLVMKS